MLELHECYLLGLKEYILFFLFLPLKYPCWEGVWHWASPLSLNRHNIYYPVWVTTLKSVVPEHTRLILFTNEDFHVFNEFLCSEYLYLLNIISWFGCLFSRLVLETLHFNLLSKTKQSHWLCSQRVWEKQQIPADLVLLYWHLMPINVGSWQIQGDGQSMVQSEHQSYIRSGYSWRRRNNVSSKPINSFPPSSNQTSPFSSQLISEQIICVILMLTVKTILILNQTMLARQEF